MRKVKGTGRGGEEKSMKGKREEGLREGWGGKKEE